MWSPRSSHGLAVTRALAVAVVAALAVTGSAAHADPAPDEGLRLPIPEAERPITLPRFLASPAVGFQFDHRPEGTYGELDVTGAFGITDDLMVHALVAPLQLSSPPGDGGFQYGETNRSQGPGVGATYRFVRGATELAVDLTGHVYTVPAYSSGGSLTPSVLLRVHASRALRLDVDPAVTFQPATLSGTRASANAVRVSVPLDLRGNITEALDLGLTTGLTVYDVSDTAKTTGIPLGFLLGYAIGGTHGPVADIDPYFMFPYLVMPGRASPTNTVQYQVGVTVTGYFYL